ncbi:MAG: ABC transporter ATP-binding protein [Spirochaetaceae bacterium]|nr:ABC transporter ATP-binding protein [Spirochaetaceae bacterium]
MSSISLSDRHQPFVDTRTGAGVLARITRMALRFRVRLAIGILGTVAAALSQLLIPRFMGQAVDGIHDLLQAATAWNPASRNGLVMLALGLLGASVGRGLFMALYMQQGEALGQRLAYSLRLAYYEKLQHLSFSYHDRVHTGDLMTRGMLDVEGVRMFVNFGLLRTFYLAVLIGFGTWQLVVTDPLMALVAVSFVPVVGWRAIVSRLQLRESWYQLQKRMSILTRVMDENLSGIRVVRAFTSQDHEMHKFDRASRRALLLARKRIRIRVRNTTVMTMTYYAAMCLVLLVGGLKVMNGDATVGRLTEFLAFMTILQLPVRQLGMMVNAFARASSSGQRLFEVLDQEPDVVDKPGAPALALARGELRFEDVSFVYRTEDGDAEALSGVSFAVGPGQTLGIVGPPGAGKSTIAHLVPRFYDVTGGRVTIDGQDIRDVTLDSLRNAVGVIQQDSFVFTSALERNVAYGDPWAERDRIARAASSAQLDTWVRSLPLGYRTLVGERGVSLSGGQRQRLSIARSVMLRPPFMIFDDSTAAIDAGTEQRIRASLREVTRQCATIIIAHRLSSLMHADEILFLDRGRVVERGSHVQLLARGGRYAALYELQARRTTGATEMVASSDGASADAGHAPGNGAAADSRTAKPVAVHGGNGAPHGDIVATGTSAGAAGGRS